MARRAKRRVPKTRDETPAEQRKDAKLGLKEAKTESSERPAQGPAPSGAALSAALGMMKK